MKTIVLNKRQIEQKINRIAHEIYENNFEDKPEFKEISLGMSNDYNIAIDEGSNMVRIGSLIFGERN